MKSVLVLYILFFSISNLFLQNTKNTEESPVLYLYVDKLPKFNYEGGLEKYISENFKFPSMGEATGTILISFIINKNGNIEKVKIEKGLNKALDEEMIRVFELMPLWEPGEKDSKKVDVIMYFPYKIKIY